ENGTLKAIRPSGVASQGTTTVNLFYGDENALTLGKNPGVEPTPSSSACRNPVSIGDANATDTANRPIFPSLFITDITDDGTLKTGDWQCGGTAYKPDAVCGVWKAANGGNPSSTGLPLPNGDTYPTLPDSTCVCATSQHCTCA